MNPVTGKDYKWFFDVYFYRAALPKVVATRENGMLKVRWQVPGQPAVSDAARRAHRRQGRDAADDRRHGRDAGRRARGVTIDPSSKILMQSDAIDDFQAWQARQPKQSN